MSRTDPRPGQVLRDVALSEMAPRARGQIPKIVQGTTRSVIYLTYQNARRS